MMAAKETKQKEVRFIQYYKYKSKNTEVCLGFKCNMQ